MPDEKPPEIPEQINPEDIVGQVVVMQTEDNKIVLSYPTMAKGDTTPNFPLAMELFASGLKTLANIMRQQQPADKPRIVLAPAIPKEFLIKGCLGRPDGN
jgi:hypothetical protein